MGCMTVLTLDDVRIRPYGWQDGDRLRRMSQRLSSRSLYQRFFSGTPRIPERYVQSLAGLDHWNHDALVGIVDDELAGIAEYVRHAGDPQRAELAILITDDWQRRGLGGHLIAFLTQLAARRGIHEFAADVLLDNRGGLAAVHSAWPGAIPRHVSGSAHFALPLTDSLPARA
jgi:GNAT superfamily N-acetyltransferase